MSYKHSLTHTGLLVLALSLSACGGNGNSNDTPPIIENTPPTASAGNDQTIDELAEVTLTGNGNDSDGSISNYQWQQISGTSVTLATPQNATTTFNAPQVSSDETLVFELIVTDDDGDTATDSVSINVANVNQLPTADAGDTQTVPENSEVTITGTANDPDGEIVSYTWQQDSGTQVVLSGADSNTLTFITPVVSIDEQLSFSLTVTDNDGGSATDSVNIDVFNVNQAPVAEAGEAQQVEEQTLVTLVGSGTDPDGTISSYQWQQTSGININLYVTDQPELVFAAPAIDSDETLTFELTVTDNQGATATDEVEITVIAVDGLISDLYFDDTDLGDCVRQTAREKNWLTIDQMTSLACVIERLETIAGIEALTSLTHLRLQASHVFGDNSPFNDLSPLENLTGLTSLSIYFSQISDISPIANLTNLTSLTLSFGRITNITPLANLQNLTSLNLDENLSALNDISTLANLTSLTSLGLAYNNISNIAPLSDLTTLTSLNLTGNRLTELSNLSNLTNIEWLGLGYNNRLTDIKAIFNLTNITGIFLAETNNIPCADLETLTTTFPDADISMPSSCIDE